MCTAKLAYQIGVNGLRPSFGEQYSYCNGGGAELKKIVTIALIAFFALATCASAQVYNFGIGGSQSSASPRTFTALHTYYISATGSNSNNCLTITTSCADISAAGLASVKCGDVILVASGTYTNSIINENAPTVGLCPSTSGGVTGSGGVYFAIVLCAGTDVMSCKVNTTSSGGSAWWVNTSNWAVEGFWSSTPIDASNCYIANNANTGGTPIHHVAFINDIASQCGDAGFASSGGGSATGSSDQTAAVGVVAWNAANSQNGGAECGSAISWIPSNGPDTSAGTHVYTAGAFLGYNSNTGAPGSPGCLIAGGHSDGEGIILDTWGAGYTTSGYLYQSVIEQSVIWHSGGSSVQIFPQANAAANDKTQYFIESNTLYAGDQDASGNGICEADLQLHGISPNTSPTTSSIYDVQKNIVLATFNTCGNLGVNPSYAADAFPELSASLVGKPITIANNYIWNSATPTSNVYNTTNNNFYLDTGSGSRAASFPFGTNTYSDPGLTSITSLWSTAPDCTGYTDVTTCMNIKYTVSAFVRPTIASTSLGYQAPSSCSTLTLSNGTSSFPSYLNSVVMLLASGFTNGATITQHKNVLINQPCGS